MRLSPLVVAIVAAGAWLPALVAAESALPPKPARHVEDRAGLLRPVTRETLDQRLAQFERDTSSQILVAILPRVPDDFALEDFTQRTAEAWGVGRREQDNGAVLFVFPQDRRLRIEVGYGLEGAIPDATAKTIIDREITPAFRTGDFDGGVARGVDALLAAAQGEYRGTGRTVAEGETDDSGDGGSFLPLLFLALFLFLAWRGGRQTGSEYRGRGRRRHRGWSGPFLGGLGGGLLGGGGSGRGGGGGFGGGGFGGGGFSGGGGSFGGGGASGSW